MSEDRQNLKEIALSIVRNENGEVLIIKKKPKPDDEVKLTWAFPGGVIEQPLDKFETAAKEAHSETGYKVKANSLISQRVFPNSSIYIYYVSCTLLSDETDPVIDVDEVEEVKWAKPEELRKHFTTDLDKVVAVYLGI